MPRPPSSPTNMPASRSPPPPEILSTQTGWSYKTVDHPRAGQCFLNQPAPICCDLWPCGHGCETNSGRAGEVIKYTIALPVVAAGHESAVRLLHPALETHALDLCRL